MKNNKEKKLLELLEKHVLFPQRFLVITNDRRMIYSYSNKSFKKCGYGISHFNVFSSSGISHERGRILNDILKIEFLISQIILIKLSNKEIDFFNYDDVKRWNIFLDNITFDKKIDFLSNFKLINKAERKVLDKIRNLRNQAAHSLNDKYLEYDSAIENEKEQFNIFRKDIDHMWKVLSEVYHDIWRADDMFDYAISLINKKYAK